MASFAVTQLKFPITYVRFSDMNGVLFGLKESASMKVAAVIPKTACPPYPATQVATVMEQELIAAVRSDALRRGLAVTADDAGLVALPNFIDSLTVVELLCVADDLLPFEVTECVVRAGGYNSIVDAVTHLVGRIETKWIRHHTGVKV